MENKNVLTFTFTIVAIILGVVLFKQFDFESLKFKNTGLAVIYIITFLFAIYFLVKNPRKRVEK